VTLSNGGWKIWRLNTRVMVVSFRLACAKGKKGGDLIAVGLETSMTPEMAELQQEGARTADRDEDRGKSTLEWKAATMLSDCLDELCVTSERVLSLPVPSFYSGQSTPLVLCSTALSTYLGRPPGSS
jgi:hypothetical protein